MEKKIASLLRENAAPEIIASMEPPSIAGLTALNANCTVIMNAAE